MEIAKPDGGVRKLGIPTVLDRFIQQAVMQVLQGRWDRTFSEHSHGFRPQRSAHQAVAKAQQYIAAGNRWVVDLDLEKFFDRVNHDKLMAAMARRVSDKRMLKLIRAFLESGVMENGLVSPVEEGTPQGGPLSPLLSNLVLDELDRELERREHRFVRYADDCNIYVASERAGKRVMQSVTSFLRRRLQLKVNEAKSAVARPQERKFLGFSFTGGAEVKRRIAPKALLRCKRRVRELTRRTRGISLRPDDEGPGPLLAWLERLLRLLPDALGAARARSVDTATIAIRDLEAEEATQLLAPGEQSGPEHDVSQRLLRLPGSSPLGRGVTQLLRTAVCGPACTVVWQGRAGDRSPYADYGIRVRRSGVNGPQPRPLKLSFGNLQRERLCSCREAHYPPVPSQSVEPNPPGTSVWSRFRIGWLLILFGLSRNLL